MPYSQSSSVYYRAFHSPAKSWNRRSARAICMYIVFLGRGHHSHISSLVASWGVRSQHVSLFIPSLRSRLILFINPLFPSFFFSSYVFVGVCCCCIFSHMAPPADRRPSWLRVVQIVQTLLKPNAFRRWGSPTPSWGSGHGWSSPKIMEERVFFPPCPRCSSCR